MNSTIENTRLSSDFLVAELSKASAYPHSVLGPVVVHETHISWVFLAGRFAYKIKKPIKTDFLDYSSLDKRHHACCEELRLDSRYADGLYLEVVPITIEEGQVRMDGDARPVEFALRMLRFNEGALLSERIDAGSVSLDDMAQLGNTIARLHRQAPVSHTSGEEVLEEIREQAMANLRFLRDDSIFDRTSSIAQLEVWTDRTFASLQGPMRQRMQFGYIRECHGDLHCDNIVYWNEHWVPFDGIEFNPKYSWIDTSSDVSFLVMDLQARERNDLAAGLLNAYLEQSGDYSALPLLRWYMVYRALVRAKVSLMRSRQESLCRTKSEHHRIQAERFISLATQFITPIPRALWITHGVSGSGKTTGSLEYVLSRGAIRLRSDVERKRLFRTSQTQQQAVGFGQGMYSATATDATYQVLITKAREILRAGFSVVVDAAFLKKADRQKFQAMASDEGVTFHILDFHADEATLRRRVLDRSIAHNDASDANLSVLERQLIDQEPLTDDELQVTIPRIFKALQAS